MSRSSALLIAAACVALMGMAGNAAAADSDTRSSKEREMLRRAQQALRDSEAQNNDRARQKVDSEQKLKEASAQLAASRSAAGSAQAALRSKLQAADSQQQALSASLAQAQQKLAAAEAAGKEVAATLAQRDKELKQTQADLALSKTADDRCEANNVKLYEYSRTLLDQYQHKGVWTALRQKEPVLGLGAVGMENVLQEYREKLDSQRIQTAAKPATR